MTSTDRTTNDPRHLPDNVIRFDRAERRTLPRWRERMEQQGLPVQDSTWRATKDAA